jgi:hypothetical protein
MAPNASPSPEPAREKPTQRRTNGRPSRRRTRLPRLNTATKLLRAAQSSELRRPVRSDDYPVCRRGRDDGGCPPPAKEQQIAKGGYPPCRQSIWQHPYRLRVLGCSVFFRAVTGGYEPAGFSPNASENRTFPHLLRKPAQAGKVGAKTPCHRCSHFPAGKSPPCCNWIATIICGNTGCNSVAIAPDVRFCPSKVQLSALRRGVDYIPVL